jgi:hypothetical protein
MPKPAVPDMTWARRGLKCIPKLPDIPKIPDNIVNLPETKPILDQVGKLKSEAEKLLNLFPDAPDAAKHCEGRMFRRAIGDEGISGEMLHFDGRGLPNPFDWIKVPFEIAGCAMKAATQLTNELSKAVPSWENVQNITSSMGDMHEAMDQLRA